MGHRCLWGRETQVTHESAEARGSETSFLKWAVRSQVASQTSASACRPALGGPVRAEGRPRGGRWCGASVWARAGDTFLLSHLRNSSKAPPLPGWTHDLARPRPAARVPVLFLSTCFSSIPPHPPPSTCRPAWSPRSASGTVGVVLSLAPWGPGRCPGWALNGDTCRTQRSNSCGDLSRTPSTGSHALQTGAELRGYILFHSLRPPLFWAGFQVGDAQSNRLRDVTCTPAIWCLFLNRLR